MLRREMERAREAGDEGLAKTLEREYGYDGIDTCAVDGMCQIACPVRINTGDLVRRLRAENQNALARGEWSLAAKHWDSVSGMGGAALSFAGHLPAALPILATRAGRAILGSDTVPMYAADLPGGGSRRPLVADPGAEAVYFSSCTTTMFGPVGGDGAAQSFLRLCERAGVRVATPDDLPSLCCGTPWKSKGLSKGYAEMTSLVVARSSGRPMAADCPSCAKPRAAPRGSCSWPRSTGSA